MTHRDNRGPIAAQAAALYDSVCEESARAVDPFELRLRALRIIEASLFEAYSSGVRDGRAAAHAQHCGEAERVLERALKSVVLQLKSADGFTR